jgi:hypothetical protein
MVIRILRLRNEMDFITFAEIIYNTWAFMMLEASNIKLFGFHSLFSSLHCIYHAPNTLRLSCRRLGQRVGRKAAWLGVFLFLWHWHWSWLGRC